MTWEIVDGGVLWRGDGESVRIEGWGDGIRVRAVMLGDVVDNEFALLDDVSRAAEVDVTDRTARVRVGGTTVIAEESDYNDWSIGYLTTRLRLSVVRADGAVVLREIGDGGALKLTPRDYRPSPFGGASLRVRFDSAASEHLAGMGLYQQPFIDLKGTTLELAHRNSQSSVPFVVSSEGYGFLWNNPSIGRASFGLNYTEWFSEAADQIDYWVTTGSPAQIADAYAGATGRAPMMPEYGLGFWQCKLRYWNQEQLLEVAREYRRRDIPIDVIVADFFHWRKMGDWSFESEFWPDPTAMVRELTELGITLVVSVWPQVAKESDNFDALRDGSMLVKAGRGIDVQYFFEGDYIRFIDMTNPRARAFLWETLERNYGSHGIEVYWLDEAEPEYGAYDFEQYYYAAGPTAKVGNLYPREYTRTVADGMRAKGREPGVSLVRAAWAGSQRHGALVWSGDVHSTFADLRAQITAGIHMGTAGIPWFTTDIGGFTGGVTDDPAFHELLVRWFQFGAFSPVMRLHGARVPEVELVTSAGEHRLATGADNEVWSFGPDIEEVLVGYIRLREALRPYTRELMRAAHEHGAPVMRGLFYEFPDDERAWTVADAYLFGPDILVAPVVEAGATSREVYLPAGATWTDAWTGAVHTGGATVSVEAPLHRLPLFARTDDALALLAGLTGIHR
ncbi:MULTISPECIES: glycoside hydrolase family 31 protein [unclassified Microbacterium]|uniref:glycoside hydrolase family 31 protein n=1 Tax=unclassified Microbacterium TaxID=2609290 RepID=UPI003018A032